MGGGHVKFYPYKKGWGWKKFWSMLKGEGGGHNKFCGSFSALA